MEQEELKTPEQPITEEAPVTTEPTAPPVEEESAIEPSSLEPEPSTSGGSLVDMIKRFAPDMDTSTPEAQLTACEAVFTKLIPFYDKVFDLATTDREAAATLYDWLETGSLPKAILRNYDKEEIAALMEELDDEGYEEDRKTFQGKVEKHKTRQQQLLKNQQISLESLAKFQEERKDWPEEKAQAFQEFVIQHYEDGADWKIDMTALTMLEKAFSYDEDVKQAEADGRVIGRNENIVTERKSRKDIAGLVPEQAVGGSYSAPEPTKKPAFAFPTRKEFRV